MWMDGNNITDREESAAATTLKKEGMREHTASSQKINFSQECFEVKRRAGEQAGEGRRGSEGSEGRVSEWVHTQFTISRKSLLDFLCLFCDTRGRGWDGRRE